jgi:hypothetical protein
MFLICLYRKLKPKAFSLLSSPKCLKLICSVSHIGGNTTMICAVVLQNGMNVVKCKTGSYSETVVPCDVDGTEEDRQIGTSNKSNIYSGTYIWLHFSTLFGHHQANR